MTWNYRVVEKNIADKVDCSYITYDTTVYEIHEVYYDKDGNISMFSADPISPYGNDLDDLAKDLEKIKEALKKSVCKYSPTWDTYYSKVCKSRQRKLYKLMTTFNR